MPVKSTFTNILALIISAAMFLSRLPLNGLLTTLASDIDPDGRQLSFEKSAKYFGIAAIIVALPTIVASSLTLVLDFSPLLSAIFIALATVMTTGALHEDALADVADGFGGGKTPEQKLDIMRDSQIGTYGAIAIVFSVLLQIAIYVELLAKIPETQFLLLIVAVNVASTIIMVWPWASEVPARTEGGLSTSLGIPAKDTAIQAGIIGFLIAGSLLWYAVGIFSALISLIICICCMVVFTSICRAQIGGHTGDTLGATKKISEFGLLLALIIAT